jgi:hypothetical protein
VGVTPFEDLQGALADANAREADRLQDVVSGVSFSSGLVEECGRYTAAVTQPLTGSDLDAWPRDPEGAQAVINALDLHPAFSEGSDPPVAGVVFGEQGLDPAEFDMRREVADFIVVGLSALMFDDRLDEERVRALVVVAAGADALSRLVRDLVLGGTRRGLDLDLNGLLPDRLIDLERLLELACAQGIQSAALGLATAGRPGRAWAKGIRRLVPARGCAGDTVVIQGSHFGSTQPAGVVVMFPGQGGGCVPAKVTAWSNTSVTVTVPRGVGQGCVGFAEPGTPSDVEAASTFAGVLESCIGPAAFNVAEKVRRLGGVAPPTPCPGCLPGRLNRFDGGAPAIDYFTANLGHDVAVEPGERVVLRWSAPTGAALSLTRVTPQGPFAPLPVPLPRTETKDLGRFLGTQPASAAYALTVSNGCGTDRRVVTVQLRRTPKLKIDAVEVVQAIQRPDNSVRLVAGKRTVARVFVDSGLTDGFDFGAGPNVVPHIVGNVVAYPVGRGFGTPGTPVPGVGARAVPAADRNRANAAHSVNVELPLAELVGDVRLEAQVAVAGHESDVGGPYKATASVTVKFLQQPVQTVVPMLVTDTLNPSIPVPTVADFTASLQEARKRFPLAEAAWIVLPQMPIALDARDRFGNSYDLSTFNDWGRLLAEIQMMLLLFQGAPTGAVRTAITPNNRGQFTDAAGNRIPKYAINGVAQTRQSPTQPPALLSRAGLTGTYAHEFGHACGFSHAPCPPPPGTPGTGDCMDPPADIDPRLPGSTDEVGFDVPARAVIENGRGELMSYCGDASRCSGKTRWPSIAGWDRLFDTLPAR